MFAWCDYLEVHPAADDYPLLKNIDPAAFRELVEDIRKHGLRANIVLWGDDGGKRWLLDGRNRLDALADLGVLYDIDGELGLKSWTGTKWAELSGCLLSAAHQAILDGNPYALAASLNVHRRHLTAEQKRDLIATLLKAEPEKSNRTIAKQTKTDHKTVAAVREKKVATGEIPQLEKTVGTDGKARKQPAKKPVKVKSAAPAQPDDRIDEDTAAPASAEERKRAYAADDAVDHVLRLVEQMTAKQRERLFLLLEETYSKDRLVTTAAKQAEKSAASDNNLEIPGFLRRTAEAAS